MIRFKLQDGTIESFLPEMREALRRVCPHEVGHAEVAAHFGARVHGVALTRAKQDGVERGIEAVAIYETKDVMPLIDWCTIKAAGSAGEWIAFGEYGKAGASKDREAISQRGYLGDFRALVSQAKAILLTRRARFDRLTQTLHNRIFESDDVITMTPLKLQRTGAYLLDERDLAGGG